MKKAFFVIVSAVMVLAGCASTVNWHRQNGVIPLEHFQTVQNAEERLVFISPVLAPDHRQSGLYIITNPEDIPQALDALGDSRSFPPRALDKLLRPFSPVLIMSWRDIPKAKHVSGYDLTNQDGIAGFSLPPFVNEFFYAYVIVRQGYKFNSNAPIEVQAGVMSLPPGSQDIYIAFFEKDGKMAASYDANPAAVKNAYDTANGYYGQLLGNKEQAGFVKIGSKERRIAAGAAYSVYSRYYTYKQETRQVYVRTPATGFGGMYGGEMGQLGTGYDPGRIEVRTETVNVPIHHELEFEIYKGDVRVFRGRTPAEITGIEVGTEYTLRWVSPVNGNRSFRFKMGLDFLGYPESGRCYID